MSIKSTIKDGKGSGSEAIVTARGELVVSSRLEFSSPFAITASIINTAYSFISPKAGKRFVITGLLIDADKNVSPSTAGTVIIYEADNAADTTVAKEILTIEMLKNTNRIITGLNLISTEGVWINLKTSDATIYATLLGYYVDA